MRLKIIAIVAVLAAVTAQTGHTANWRPIASDGEELVEIDKARIARVGEGKTLAWSRLVLGRELQIGSSQLNYSAVEALNRYDCEKRSFTTVKRVFLLGGKPVKREDIASPKEMQAAPDSIDDKLLVEACKLRTVGEMKKITEAADRLVGNVAAESTSETESPPRAMFADMRRSGENKQPSIYTVEATPPSKIGMPSKADLAARAASEMSSAPATPPVVPANRSSAAHTQADTYTYLRSAARSPRKKSAPAEAPVVSRVHWAYEGEGAPANWSKLRPEYATCGSGKRQSPIDIRDGIRVDLEPIKFDYKPTHFRIVDNGHTVEVNVGAGSTVGVMGRQFELIQLHFHRPAEERINGKTYDMVVHLVHKDLDNHLAVIAVLLEKGSEHPTIQTLWSNLPLEVGQDVVPSVAIDLNGLLPENRNYWTYMGSLTTPPCTEDVLWMVLKQPVQISAEQVSIFSRLYRNNARPVQPANNRLIKESR